MLVRPWSARFDVRDLIAHVFRLGHQLQDTLQKTQLLVVVAGKGGLGAALTGFVVGRVFGVAG